MYDFEPDEEVILDDIIPKNIAIQIHSALLENLASEQGSRMTAMDNATRNANDMIDRLTLFYNRSRQALITKELIEIILQFVFNTVQFFEILYSVCIWKYYSPNSFYNIMTHILVSIISKLGT